MCQTADAASWFQVLVPEQCFRSLTSTGLTPGMDQSHIRFFPGLATCDVCRTAGAQSHAAVCGHRVHRPQQLLLREIHHTGACGPHTGSPLVPALPQVCCCRCPMPHIHAYIIYTEHIYSISISTYMLSTHTYPHICFPLTSLVVLACAGVLSELR